MGLLLLVLILSVGCGSSTPLETENGVSEAENETDAPEDENEADCDEEEFADWMEDAASALPEPWMAYPGSMVDIDWQAEGMNKLPAWLLITPANTKLEHVSDYYHSLAKERDDFELYDAASDEWLWDNNIIYIAWDYHPDNPERIEIDFIFHDIE